MSKKFVLGATLLGAMTLGSNKANAQTVEEAPHPETTIPAPHHIQPEEDNTHLNPLLQEHTQLRNETISHLNIDNVRYKRAKQDLLLACKKSGFDMDKLHMSYLNDDELMISTESSFMVGNLKDHKGIGISDDGLLAGIEYSHIEDPEDGRQGVGVSYGRKETLENPDMSRYVSYYRHVIASSADSVLTSGAQPFLQQLNKQYPMTEEEALHIKKMQDLTKKSGLHGASHTTAQEILESPSPQEVIPQIESSTLGLDNPINPFYYAVKNQGTTK